MTTGTLASSGEEVWKALAGIGAPAEALIATQRDYVTEAAALSSCSGCGLRFGEGDTVSPLAHALRQRCHPQWTWLQCRYAGSI